MFTMSPMMAKIGSEAEFVQCDITYDDLKEHPYLFMQLHLTLFQWSGW